MQDIWKETPEANSGLLKHLKGRVHAHGLVF